jgi:hypothetical protein
MDVMLITWLPLLSLLLLAGMLACAAFGRYLARRREALDPDGTHAGGGVVDGAVFALLGLIVAFSFSGAVSRFDERRHLAVEEANAIGTAYLRLALVPEQSQPEMRDDMRQYLESRIRFYQDLPDADAAEKELLVTQHLQTMLWTQGIAATRGSQPATMLLLPALNEMFDIVTSRTMVIFEHPPQIIFGMLFGLSLIAATLAGYSMTKARSPEWIRMCAFAAVTAFTFHVIVDIEFPRAGLIRSAAFDQALANLRDTMK